MKVCSKVIEQTGAVVQWWRARFALDGFDLISTLRYRKTLKTVSTDSPLDAQHERDNVEKKLAISMVKSHEKLQTGLFPRFVADWWRNCRGSPM